MQVTVNSYFEDPALGARRDFSITLYDYDGEKLFPKNWDSWSSSAKYKKLRAIADIYCLQYAASRNLRSDEVVAEEIQNVILKDLTDVDKEDFLALVRGS